MEDHLAELFLRCSSSACQEISCIFWNPNIHFRVQAGPPHLLIASQSRSGRFGEQMNVLSVKGFELQSVRHVVRWLRSS